LQDNLYFCIMLDCKHHIKMKPFVRRLLGAAVSVAVLYSCASVGRLEGGPIDEEPPHFVTGSPLPGALHNKKSKISIEFDEFIKLEKANEKVVISPPQVQQPEIKANGKRVVVNLQDTLKANTTYTIDFADAIQDNNEGNPMQGFTYTFSTGAELDSMAIAGTLLDASNLEPVKGVLVGLHANLADSAFTTLPFDRVGRTDSRGQFSIRGVSPGKYRIYALMDADQNFKFSQPTEVIAFNDSVIIPSMERRMRQDTLWRDSLTVDTIVERQYTHFLPDDVLLRSFKEKTFSQRLMKTERLTPEKFSFYFTAPADSLPLMKGLNFDEKDAFVIEQTTGRNDTIHYWIKDSLLYQQDTLRMSLSYLYTDTLNQLVPRTDTLRIVSKVSWQKLQEKKLEETKSRMSLDDLFNQIQEGNLKELNLIVKADVQGSVEAVKQSLTKLSNEEIVVKCIHGGVGAINESDVTLASASNAIIIGFNVRPDATAKATAETEGVDIRLYKVIYQAIEDVEAAMKGMLDPVYEEKIIGHAEVRQIFKASAIGNIAGSYVLDGVFTRGCKVRITREGELIYEGALASLKRFKDDVKEVKAGFECGLVFEGFDKMKEFDVVEAYIMVEVPR